MKTARRRVLAGLLSAAALTGCSLFETKVLRRPPRGFDSGPARPPVVFVHGAFGSRLRDSRSGREIWPVGSTELLFSNYASLELPLDPDSGEALADAVVAHDVFEEVGNLSFYGSLLEALRLAGGYRRATAGTPVEDGSPCQYAYLYDWRRDFAEAAQGLDALIDQVRQDYAQPDLKVDLVAHSSGGLVARYFMLYGAAPLAAAAASTPTFAGAAKVRRAVAIGVPEIGIARAAQSLVSGEPIGLNRVWPSTLVTSHTPFQLLPHGDDAWLAERSGRLLVADAYEPALWREHRMAIFDSDVRSRARHDHGGGAAGRAHVALLERAFVARLERARRFRDAIRAAPLPAGLPYYVIAGSCRPTLGRLVVEPSGRRRYVRSAPLDIHWPEQGVDYTRLMLEPGDGMVTLASARARPTRPTAAQPSYRPALDAQGERLVCASHNQLAVNRDCQRALLLALGA
jgi:hypothetical protein